MAKLALWNRAGKFSARHIVLTDGRFVCGRSLDCDFVVDHPSVSRRHVEFVVSGTHVELTDLGSRNGTHVEGARVSSATLRVGQRLDLGKVAFVLVHVDDRLNDLETASALDDDDGSEHDDNRTELSPAQRVVLNLALQGMSEKEIAVSAGLSTKTIHNHMVAIYKALSVHSRAELLARYGV